MNGSASSIAIGRTIRFSRPKIAPATSSPRMSPLQVMPGTTWVVA